MREFIFDLQRFTDVTIAAGDSYTLDGVTYTAVTDAVLNLDDNGKISGIASGKVQSVVTDATDSLTVTFDASDDALTFTATSDGKVISITPFPIEFISGEFTYNGSRIDITAGSDLAIATKRGDYILRNQNHFVTDSAYIFTSTSLTSDSEHVISSFSLTNGTDVRRLQLEQLGTVINHFDQQGVTLIKGSSEVLNLGDYKLTATAKDKDAGLNFELGEKGLTFVPNKGDGTLTVALSRNGTPIFGGELECTNGSITLGYDKAVTFAKDTSFNFTTRNNTVLTVTANGEATTNIALTDNGITFTPGTGDGGLDISLSKEGEQVFEGSLNITDGTIIFDPGTKKFSFSDGTKIALGVFGLELDIEVVGDTTVGSGTGANFGIDMDDNGNFIFTPDANNGGSFNIALKRIAPDNADLADDVDAFFENNVTVKGPIMFNPATKLLTLKDGTEVSFAFNDNKYTLTATAQGDAASKISLTEEGISITPQQGDGTLKLTLGSAAGSMPIDIEVLSGGFVFGENGALNVSEGTELQLTFSENYSVKFKTTDKAGGNLSLGTDGITFTPNAGDGHLELSVTRGDETRTASLEMTGSLTYKLDGSISLAKDTVLKNVFEDGNILTITANTDASGSILFHPQNGLSVAPSTPDALNISLTTGDLEVVNISSITGTLSYSGGLVTASDGSQAHLLFYNDAYEIELRTNGGSASLEFTEDKTSYIANEGATFVLDYLDGTTLEIQNGTFTDIYATETGDAIELISEGSNFKCNDDEFVFTLEKAGNYNLNGMKVTTTEDNTRVLLNDYKTITVDGISYTPLDDNVTLTLGDTGITCAGGKVSVIMDGTENPLEVDVTDGSLSFDNATKKFSFAEGAIISMQTGDTALQFIAKEDFSVGVEKTDDKVSFNLDGTAELEVVNGTRKTTLDFTGGLVYESGGKISLEDGTEINLAWEDGNSLKLNSHGSNGSILLDADKGVRITSDDENLDMTLTTAEGYSSTISSIKGSLWYKAGTVTLDADTFITGKNTVEGHAIGIKFEAIDGTGKLNFANAGFTYSAGTGKNKVTYTLGDQVSSFTVNKGSVFIQGRVFNVAEGSDVATNFKDFIPAQYFKTGEAGTYTINGKTIETTAANLQLIATDDYMSFKTSDDVIKYDGMTFAGSGNVSLSSDNVVLGAGVEAKGFGKDKSFVLAEPGQVTADEKVFELTQVYLQKDGESIPVPLRITVTGAEDGFIFSRTTTEESEEYQGFDPPEVGVNFTEKFVAEGDNSYRTRTDPFGLQEVIGISADTTITGGASFGGEPSYNYFDIVTETNGKFVIGEKVYVISEGSTVGTKLTAHFDENGQAYARGVKDLNGTVSGDFSAYKEFKVNENPALKLYGDTDVSIVADDSGYEILGLDKNASLQVSEAGIYKVNGTEITAGASDVIVGTGDDKARLYTVPAALADYMLHKTEAGYPAMAKLAFHPDEENPDPPKNYHSAEKWTTTSTDNLELSAIHYSPENPTGKWVILVHGYGKQGAAMNAFAEPYLAQGMDVLIVDQRTAGDSEGDWLTMGVAEAKDLAIWTQEIAKTNANAQITLHGVSMGAATVMLSAALPDTANVSAIIEDCGYGNIADVFATLMYAYGSEFGLSGVDYYELFDDVATVAKIFDGGYDVTDAAPIDSIAAVTVPSLFIHGADDGVIPSNVADALYNKSGASNKTKLIIEGAGHAQSIELDTEAYFAAVKNLISSSTTDIGALIDSDADSKLLRGTIYNDTITNSGQSVTIEALGGDDYIVNDVDSSVTAAEFGNLIDMGDGNDTIYNHHSYNPTIYGGAGDDSIVISRGHKTFADGGDGNDSIIGRLADNPDSDWAIGGHATVLGGADDDYINTGYTNDSTIDGGTGDDTIITCGLNNTIDGGTGKNLISLDAVEREDLSEGSFIVLNGQTTVEGFKTGFGEGTDTVYIKGKSPAVDFKDEGLTFYYDNNTTKSLTFSDITTTDKLNIYYEAENKTVAEVFIADGEWYSVTEDDLSVMNNSELYFVGATAKMNHGIDFSGITGDVNATLLGHNYPDYVENLWINNIHSIKGGAGLTTITGSDKSDTIIAGMGKTTINAAAGDDFITLGSASALVEYNYGDGNDLIQGFRADSTLSISGGEYYSKKHGEDLILTVGKDEITLQGAARLSSANIIGTTSVEGEIAARTNGYVNNYYDYGTPITDQSSVKKLLEGDLNGDMALLLENKSADFSKSTGRKNVTLIGGENQDVAFNKEGSNTAVVDENTGGEKNILLGGGGDLVFVEDTDAQVNITASKSNDIIVSKGENVSVDFKGGKTDLFAVGGRMLLNGYDASNNSGFGTNYADILAAINDGEISFNKGKMSIDSAIVAFNGAKSGVVNIFDLAGNIQKVGFASKDAELNASDETANLIMVGKENSTLISGSGNDTIFADEGSRVDAGAGKNSIFLEERDENDYGVTIVLDSSGKNTITNFQSGFDYASDTLFFGVNDTVDFKFDGTNLTVQNNGNSQCAFIENIASDAPFVEISAADDNAPMKIVAAKKDAIITVNDELADLYIGEKSGVDFTNYAGDLMVNLGSAEASIGGGEVLFSGINQITAGKGNATIIGSNANETLVAGIGETSINGGGGRNLLIGNNSKDKFGSTEFFILGTNNGAQHTIRGFEFIEDGGTNRDTFDALTLDLANIEVTDIKVVDSNVEVAIKGNESGAVERFTIEGAAGKEFLVDRGGECETVAQIAAKEVTVKNEYVDFYYASDKDATVKVGDIKSAKIWLDSPEHNDGVEFVGDFTVIDARGSSAEVDMGGNSVSNTIYGGLGNASLWGGNGGNDLLVGGSGQNMFSYRLGNGSDTITGVNDGDTVDLAGVTLDDIVSADFTNNALALNFSDGGKLTVNENGKGVNFVVGDQTFYVNNEHNGFVTDK